MRRAGLDGAGDGYTMTRVESVEGDFEDGRAWQRKKGKDGRGLVSMN
jgi:hypothetical protein